MVPGPVEEELSQVFVMELVQQSQPPTGAGAVAGARFAGSTGGGGLAGGWGLVGGMVLGAGVGGVGACPPAGED